MTRSASTHKEAGIIVYLQEELTDARMRCDQLKKFVDRAVRHISDSPQKDTFYEVAGDLIYGIPDALFRLDKALDATALAAARLDYEELKQSLKPEKVELLEEVLKGVRVRHLDRRAPSAIKPSPEGLAFPQEKTAMFKAASKNRVAEALYRIASGVEAASLSPVDATMRLHRVLMALAQTPDRAVQAMGPIQADSREKVMEGFKGANPDLTDEQLEEIADQWEKNKDVVKDKQADFGSRPVADGLKELLSGHKALARARIILEASLSDEVADVALVDLDRAQKLVAKCLDQVSRVKTARYEEGKSADPTENMSEEDAAEWKRQTEENRDNFKSAAGKTFRYPEGQMTEEDWVDRYADSVEEYRAKWTDLFDRRKFNSLEGDGAQQRYEDDLKLKAQKPRFRAWKKGKETYQDISKATFEWAKKRGINSKSAAMEFKSAATSPSKGSPSDWTRKGEQWVQSVKYAGGVKHDWTISGDGPFLVQVKTEDGSWKGKTKFSSLEEAQKFAWKFIGKANGEELLEEAKPKSFTKSATQTMW